MLNFCRLLVDVLQIQTIVHKNTRYKDTAMTACMTPARPKSINKPEKTHVLDGSAIFTALGKNTLYTIISIVVSVNYLVYM